MRGVNVDGVLIIGEHGDYEDNEWGQKLYPRRRLFDSVLSAMIATDTFVPVFNGFAQKRDRDAMCVNDAPVPGASPIDDGFVQRFLDDFFPAPSQFERRGV